MGIKTIIRALEINSVRTVNIAMAERLFGSSLVEVIFELSHRLSDETVSLYIPLSMPQNNPYVFTGEERTPYRAIWERVCQIATPNPLQVLGQDLNRDYTKNLPNALHLLGGWLESWEELVLQLQEKGLAISIETMGNRGYNPILLKELADQTRGLYQGHRTDDASVHVRSRGYI